MNSPKNPEKKLNFGKILFFFNVEINDSVCRLIHSGSIILHPKTVLYTQNYEVIDTSLSNLHLTESIFTRTPFDQRESFCANTLRPQLEQLDRFMGGVQFVAGQTLTYVDFMFWEILDHMKRFDDSLFKGLDNLNAYFTRYHSQLY